MLGLREFARTWSPIPLSSDYGGNRLYVLVGLLCSLPLLLLSLWAIFRSRLTWQVRLLLFTPAILISLAHALSVGSLRYRIPIEPLLAIAAADCVVRRTYYVTEGLADGSPPARCRLPATVLYTHIERVCCGGNRGGSRVFGAIASGRARPSPIRGCENSSDPDWATSCAP